MRGILIAAMTGALAAAAAPAAWAGTDECNEAVETYNSRASDISDALQRYGSCLSGSNGRDDCYSEFSRLRSAQDDFESAVSRYRSECD